MSDSEAKYNLITRSMHNTTDSFGGLSYKWEGDWLHVSGTASIDSAPANAYISAGSLKADTAYTLSVEFLGGIIPDGLIRSVLTGGACRFEINHTPGASQCATSTVGSGNDAFQLYGPRVALGESVDFRTRYMLVEGTTPAAWAPAEGETLAGGGALMSANLLDGLRPNVREGAASADGTLHFPARASGAAQNDCVSYDLQGQSALKENQTYHVGLSVRCASASTANLRPFVGYKDAAGHKNWVLTPFLSVGTSWGRAEGTLVVPSGMTPFVFGVQVIGACPETWMASPTLSLGSPVPLATSAHTPYATQDHISATYATKASLKVTDDSIKAEVTARTKTDRLVSEVSSRLTQTADGFSASIDRLSDTDRKVNSWFGFGADASGNPQLTMGSSSSPVVGVYTNAGLAYKARSGATLLELDGASRSSTMPHVHADDVSMGSWQWVPTQNGTHFTLQWIGG